MQPTMLMDFTEVIETVIIDPEFKALIPPLSREERAGLEESVQEFGCLDPLKVWAGHNILLDGHNRYEICYDYRIPYTTVEIELPDRAAAYNWIINNQLGRRNVTPEQASYLRGKRYQAEKTAGHGKKSGYQNDNQKTHERLADEYKVAPATIMRDAQFAQAVDTLAEVAGEEAREAILTRDTQFTKKEVVEAGKQAEEDPEGAKEWFLNKKMKVHYSSETPEWYTPNEITYRVLLTLGQIDLDPCSNSHEEPNIPASQYYTAEDDGLAHDWHGKVYMNPPYGREIDDWVSHLCEQFKAGNITEAIALVPSRTDTGWFRLLRDFPRCFIWGRLKFGGNDNKNSAPFPSMAVYIGNNIGSFTNAFNNIGDIYSRIQGQTEPGT